MTTNISVSCCHSLVAQGLLCICHSAELKLQAPQPTPTAPPSKEDRELYHTTMLSEEAQVCEPGHLHFAALHWWRAQIRDTV